LPSHGKPTRLLTAGQVQSDHWQRKRLQELELRPSIETSDPTRRALWSKAPMINPSRKPAKETDQKLILNMKARLIVCRLVTATWLTTPVLADNPNDSQDKTGVQSQSRTTTQQSGQTDRWNQLGAAEKANDLIGTEVKNYQGDKLGKVDELGVDLEAGRLVTVILSIGGFLGVGDRLVAVPPSALHWEPANKVVHLDADKSKLKEAPQFEMSKWSESWDSTRLNEINRYYGPDTYSASRSTVDKNRPVEHATDVNNPGNRERDAVPRRDAYYEGQIGHIARASKIIGTSIRNLQDESIGKVDNLVVDLPAGRVVAVVVSTGGFLGLGSELSAIPPSAFHVNSDRNLLTLDATKESLAQAPHFKSDQWPNLANPQYTEGLYRSYRVEPYFSPTGKDVDNTARNVRDRDRQNLTPLDQGNNPTDLALTSNIRKEIVGDKEMSFNARNVKIITVNGKVTLRGAVNSGEEKRKIAEIARKYASENVDDQLEIKNNN